MIRKYEWVAFNDGLDKDACDKIIRLAEDKLAPADEETHDRPLENLEDPKKTDIVWTDEQWIYDAVWPSMAQANKEAGWKYEISSAETFQIARYKKGMFYDWHADGKGDHFSVYDTPTNKLTHGRTRKLSMSAILNDDYEGGEFQIVKYDYLKPLMRETWVDHLPENHISTVEVEKGTIIIFPSDMYHRVKPVTKGIRYTLTLWFLGPPYV